MLDKRPYLLLLIPLVLAILAVAGFGFGATLWVKLAGSWGHLIENVGLSKTFTIYGIVFLVAVVLGGFTMIFKAALVRCRPVSQRSVKLGKTKSMISFPMNLNRR